MVVIGRYSKGWSIITLVLAKQIFQLYKTNGMLFVSQYCAMCQISLMKFMSDSPDRGVLPAKSTWCGLTRCGLPKLIASSHRKLLRRRDANARRIAQVYLTIFALGRLYKRAKTFPNLVPIESPLIYKDGDQPIWEDLIFSLKKELPELIFSSFPKCLREIELGFSWKPSWSSGPSSLKAKENSNMLSLGVDSYLFFEMFNTRRHYLKNILKEGQEESKYLFSLVKIISMYWYPRRIHLAGSDLEPIPGDSFEEFVRKTYPSELDPIIKRIKPKAFGKLGRKYEGGGKVRVFTIADSIRQSLLRPIHNWVMQILRNIPQDGTYHQLEPLKRLVKLTKGKGPVFCYDLSAATDRFPADLQRDLLSWAFGSEAADSWLKLMTEPLFFVPWANEEYGPFTNFEVGQPLGLYSSWPVFTLTHHLLVQYCAGANRSGKWFHHYALLGDDIVIADRAVATRYRTVISILGLEISEKKSLISERCCMEFAKRFICDGVDISPISYKVVFSLIPQTLGSLVERIREFRDVRRSEPYRWSGAGFRTLSKSLYPKNCGKRWKRLHLILTSPKGPFALPPLWWHSFYASRPVTEQAVAVVRASLLSKLKMDFNPSLGNYSHYIGESTREDVVMGNWLLTYYRLITPFLLDVMKSTDLTPWYTRPTMSETPFRTNRIELVRFGLMFTLWERVLSVSRRPSLLSIEPHDADVPTGI